MAPGWMPTTAGIALAMLMSGVLEAHRSGESGPAIQIGERVRANDIAAASFLKEAIRRSATIRRLVEQIQTSDVLVMVARSNDRTLRGLTQFSSAQADRRLLITRITTFLIEDEQFAVLGHELQHVCEIAAAPEVTNQAALRQLFERIGERTTWSGDRYETAAALAIERRVLEEVRQVR
ncbi:MAG: hypothetical protein ACM4AI_11940 [Acidobacteriota bacterium]